MPIGAVAEGPDKVVRIGYQKSGAFLLVKNEIAFAKGSSSHFLLARALAEAGLSFNDINPIYLQPSKARAALTAKLLASKLGVSEAVMLRKPRYDAEPMNAESIADQQLVADTFFRLGLVPKAIRPAEAVFQTQQ